MIETVSGIALLEEMLQIPSITGGEDRLGAWLVDRLTQVGFEASRDQVGNLIATWGRGTHEIVLLGHIDTVPGLIEVRRHGNRLSGRGAVDAKGPLAAAIVAVTQQDRHGPCRLTVIGAVAEEGDSRGARHLLHRTPPESLIVLEPSGWDAVTVGYKGSLRLSYRLRQRAAHGAGPTPSAGDRAIAFIRRLQDHIAAHQDTVTAFDRLDARVLSVNAQAPDGMTDDATLVIGLRLPPDQDIDALKRLLAEWATGAELAFDVPIAAFRAGKNTPLVRAFLQAIRDAGGTPRFKMKTGTSDMNILAPAWGCPTLAYGPGDSKLDHTPDEAIDLDEFERGVDVVARALRTQCR